MKKIILTMLVLLNFLPAFAQAAEISDFSGAWKLAHTDGSTFTVNLKEDGTCTSTWAGGETGTWKVDGDRALLSWIDGWHDILIKEKDGYRKLGFAPGVAITDPPSNSSVPEKI